MAFFCGCCEHGGRCRAVEDLLRKYRTLESAASSVGAELDAARSHLFSEVAAHEATKQRLLQCCSDDVRARWDVVSILSTVAAHRPRGETAEWFDDDGGREPARRNDGDAVDAHLGSLLDGLYEAQRLLQAELGGASTERVVAAQRWLSSSRYHADELLRVVCENHST